MAFLGKPKPTYEDFFCVSFARGLTYRISDDNVAHSTTKVDGPDPSVIFIFCSSTVLGSS